MGRELGTLYKKAIIAGLTGALVMLGLFAFSMFMADQDMKEYYKIPRGYDNDFVGIQWIFFFIASSLGTFGLIGAVAARVTAGEATSIIDTIKASTVAGSVPLLLLTTGILCFAVAYVGGAAFKSPLEAVFAIAYVLIISLFMVAQYLIFVLVCLSISAIGGISYAAVSGMARKRKAPGAQISYVRPALAGLACGSVVLAMFLAGHAITGGQYSMPLNFLEVLLFLIISLVAGALAVHVINVRDIRVTDALKGALAAGALTGIAGGAGNVAGAIIRQYNVQGILIEAGTKYFLNGLIMATVGGLMYMAVFRKTEMRKAADASATVRLSYMSAIKTGLLAGAAMAAYSMLSGLASMALSLFNAGSDTASSVNVCMITYGLPGQVALLALLIAAAVIAVRHSQAMTLNGAIAVAAVTGALAGLVSIAGDTINRFLTLWYTPYASADFRSADIITSNLSAILDCAPAKILIIVAICALAGTIYGAWILQLKFAGDKAAEERPASGGR
ncbi:hypothetical protein [Methanocella arvoryzae]|nr:hypothetical protein [Methanocella arvoryzae]